jgi:hypothetical protein
MIELGAQSVTLDRATALGFFVHIDRHGPTPVGSIASGPAPASAG